MDPISAFVGIAGLGMSIFNSLDAAKSAQQVADVSSNILGLQVQENQQRQVAMQIAHRRTTLQIARNTQQKNALALAAATNQGGQFGSGLQGGQASITSEGTSEQTTENQQFEVGTNLFNIQNKVSGQQALMAQLQSQQATAQGYAGVGSALMGSSGNISNIFGNIFGNLGNTGAGTGGQGQTGGMGYLVNQ